MWERISRGAGLVIVGVILVLVVLGRASKDPATVQTLLLIAAGLLGLARLFRRDGNGGNGK